MSENQEQQDYWNGAAGERWVEGQARLDRALYPFGQAMLRRALVRAGEHVIDVGCGCGAFTLEAGEAVGPAGSAIGLDFSRTMLRLAQQRAKGNPQISFAAEDATVFVPYQPVDLLVSRFGVMFFADPVHAFSHLRGLLKPGGRLAFVCWRKPKENPWMTLTVEAAKTVLPPVPSPPLDAPGPFAFASDSRIRDILGASGFTRIEIDAFDTDVEVSGASGGLEEAVQFSTTSGMVARLLDDAPQHVRDQVVQAVRSALAPYVIGGSVRLKAATWIVSAARNP